MVKNAWNRQVSNKGALIGGLEVEVGDAAHDQPPRYLLALGTGGERGEVDFGDLGPRDPGAGVLVVDGVGVFDGCPGLSSISPIAALTVSVWRTVTDTSAPPRIAARTARYP